MGVRLKRLVLHGFKSFAEPVELVFEPGITAIVGPNGSGKSNIVEAIRWVLGEQSPASWRGRRSDDVIFAGGQGRAALGMAEVSLTLEQDDQSLGLPFPEITVTRRVFRDGEQQYLLNGTRVRLRDMLRLAAALGAEHVIINQGQVEAVLQQRPSERRALVEHAAGLSVVRARQQEALRDLADAEAHAARLDDLLRELEPHLAALAQAAQAAEEARAARLALHDCLEQLYAWRWHEVQQALGQQTARLVDCEQALAAAQAQLAQAVAAEQATQAAVQDAEHAVACATQAAQAQAERVRQLQHEHQLAHAQAQAVAVRLHDLTRQQQAFNHEATALEEELERLSVRLQHLQAERQALEEEIAARERRVETTARERSQYQAQLRQLQHEESALAREQAALEATIEQQQRTLAQLREEHAQLHQRLQAHEAALAAHRQQALQAEQERDAAAARAERATAAQAAARDLLATREAEHTTARRRVLEIERALASVLARLEAIEQARALDATRAIQTVLQAAQAGTLHGIYGTLSTLLDVPPRYERAIEATLGGRLSDIVVARWADAEAAVAYLKQTRAGRATFHPLDTIRSSTSSLSPLLLRETGVHGIAAHLVTCEPAVLPVVQLLLGRVLVVDNLPVAHRLLALLPAGWTMVTLDGDVVRSSGSVTGGAARRERGVLALERERRECEAARTRLQAELEEAQGQEQAASQAVRAAQQTLEQARRAADAEAAALRQAQLAVERAQQEIRAAEAALAHDAERLRQLEQALHQAAEAHAMATAQLASVSTALAERSAARQQLEAQLAASDDAEERAALAAAQRRLAALTSALNEVRSQYDTQSRQRARVQERQAALVAEREQLEHEQAKALQTVERLAHALAEAERLAHEARAAQMAAEERLATARAQAHVRASERVAAERAVAAAQAALERQHAALERTRDAARHLLEQATLELDEPAGTERADIEARLQARAASLPAALDSRMLEHQARHLRARWQRLRHAESEAAIVQYQAEKARYDRLRRELNDVRQAAQTIRETLRTLDQQIAQAYRRTVRALDQAFRQACRELFGGGTARLIDQEGEQGGIDLIVQPPGKKVRSLSALSGGERALAALALLVAMLRVHPTPFCVFDEVDAALDEANAGRVSSLLQHLAQQTQLIIVTHNRVTIEAATILYGVTMGSDGASRVLSLRLPTDQATNAAD
ncbi:chromosome segregation protein SMC [Thermorudis peleae]|uniref:chromosome segregation protein SMC n=1 Tax=Thermorudis peleae TaxID=1382356 RepID=UPI0005713B4E|nr:chromosome segregation protein SMC [Thermorudis peleae]